MHTVPLNDLKRQYVHVGEEVATAVNRVLTSGWYLQGRELEGFEAEFAAFVGRRHCVGVANGTDALELTLRAVGVGPSDEVIMVANAGMYAAVACLQIGATPVYVDIDPVSMTMSPEAVAAARSSRVRCVVVTHLYGYLADVDSIRDALDMPGVPVIEDCAQAHGARLQGRPAGSFSTAATFSFYPTKNLGACGDAGAIVADDVEVVGRLRQLRQYGWGAKYHAELPYGRNSRLDEIQAAILRVKLPHVDRWNQERRRIYEAYRAACRGTGLALNHPHDERFVAHLCVARCRNRDIARDLLTQAGIQTDIHYPLLDFQQPALAVVPHRVSSSRESIRVVAEILTLPCHADMTVEEVDRVCDAIRRIPSQVNAG
jgi:dTDP-4-amino-4,6-dideoxygalactose transaminase